MTNNTKAAQQALKEFDRYFTSANGVDVPERVTVSRDEWRTLRAALQDKAGEVADFHSRSMFVARLEKMQANRDVWLTISTVLALLNDCDMLASSGLATPQPQPAPSPQAPGRRQGPPGITLEPQGHDQPAAPVVPAPVDERQAWLPIETAPKTGRTLLLGFFNSCGKWRAIRGQWMSQSYIDEYWEESEDGEPGWYETVVESDDMPNCWRTNPTHWMPIPPAPQTKGHP